MVLNDATVITLSTGNKWIKIWPMKGCLEDRVPHLNQVLCHNATHSLLKSTIQSTEHKDYSSFHFFFFLVSIFFFFCFKQTGLSSKSLSSVTTLSSSFGLTSKLVCQPKSTTSCEHWFLQNISWFDQGLGNLKKISLRLSHGIACSAHTTNVADLLSSNLHTAKGFYFPSQSTREFIQISSWETSFMLDSALFVLEWNSALV